VVLDQQDGIINVCRDVLELLPKDWRADKVACLQKNESFLFGLVCVVGVIVVC
jgi:hypothetical protein